MSPDESALLAAVCAAPDDDLPRLVYADWLEETDEPANVARAEFIRLSIEHDRTTQEGRDRYWESPSFRELSDKADKLAGKFWLAWCRPLFNIPRVDWPGKTFRHCGYERGFVCYVEFPNAKAFTDHAERVFSLTPVRYVRFGRLTPRTAPKVLGSPLYRGVKELDLGFLIQGTIGQLRAPQNEIGLAGAEVLADNRYLGRLEKLRLAGDHIGDAGAELIAAAIAAGQFPHLRDLDLFGNDLTAPGLAALAATGLANIRSLDLANNPLGPTGLAELLTRCSLESLATLKLGYTRLGDEGVRSLTANVPAHVRFLNLGANAITDAGIASLTHSWTPTQLDSLYLDYNQITAAGAEVLAQWSKQHRVRYITLGHNPISEEERARLRTRFHAIVNF